MAIGAITAGYSRFVPANRTTVALTDLVAILLIATGWAIAEATTASVVVVLCFNFFFLPPIGTFTIADPQNWVALIAFAPESRPTRDAARCRGSEVPGTGMGLGIVEQIAPAHGGAVSVASGSETGTESILSVSHGESST